VNNPYCYPTELKEKLARGDDFLLLDVRTPEEWDLANLPQARLIPMDTIRTSLDELEEHLDREIVVLCHHGVRSANVQGWLAMQGFTQVRNLVGGIDRYSTECDPNVPRY
jgi:rhodanese-related sulfurtransferase